MDGFLPNILSWNDLGPVGILMFMLVCVVWLARWLARELLADKRSQIERLEKMNDRLTEETAATLKQILDAVRQREVER